MRQQGRKLQPDVRANKRGDNRFGKEQPAATAVRQDDFQIGKSLRWNYVQRRQRIRSARAGVDDDGQVELQRRRIQKIADFRQRIERLKLRLQLQRAKAQFFDTAFHLITIPVFADVWIDASRA